MLINATHAERAYAIQEINRKLWLSCNGLLEGQGALASHCQTDYVTNPGIPAVQIGCTDIARWARLRSRSGAHATIMRRTVGHELDGNKEVLSTTEPQKVRAAELGNGHRLEILRAVPDHQ